jgi:hypothetical protein
MKKLFLTTVIFSVLLFIGCQENSITDPVGTLEKTGDPVNREIIQMNFVIDDPLAGSIELVGEVYYTHEVFNSDQLSNLFLVSVSLDLNAQLNDMLGMMHLDWSSSGKSEDSMYISEEGIYILQKAYSITNRNDVVLIVQYLVTTEGVGIPNCWLELID